MGGKPPYPYTILIGSKNIGKEAGSSRLHIYAYQDPIARFVFQRNPGATCPLIRWDDFVISGL